MSITKNEKVTFVSFARVVGILLVVLGHSYPFNVSIPNVLDQLRSFIYTFHMPLFILISGYLAALTSKGTVEYISKRAKKLLIPYFVLSLVAFVPKMLIQQLLNDNVEFSIRWLIRSELVPRENVWGHFWYIPVIFFYGVFYCLFIRKVQNNRYVLILMLIGSYALLWLPKTTDWFALEDIRNNLFYYVLGVVFANFKKFKKIISNKFCLLGFPVAIVLFISPVESVALGAVLMIVFILCVGTMIDLKSSLICQLIERYSYTIFLLSWPAQAITEVLLNKLLHLPVPITMIGMFIGGIAIPMLCVKIIKWLEKYISMCWIKTIIGM